ncbi:tripartite tricarboxylate transporter substrate binding protein [Sediminivirga luteola]|uniref:ABC transporter substrate-binding protein n=1 Tax=Sediminivirga luteola TaxID=1774748 RepID=A0A8J2XLG6_9MICO|nr:tripartite tricarboxylate transporter substrate binding protein [Sediminivirga luteola]GGA22049.1 ABC transporter substrate-binding protein [Sediminivirga luteola]
MGTRKVSTVIAALSGVALVTAGCVGNAAAEDYPSQPVEIIVPWGAGGSSDVLIRAFAEPLEQALGQSVLVVNRPGGGSAIGAAEAARAQADGYTLLHSSASTFITVPLRQEVNFSAEDFRSVVSLGDQPIVLVANPDTGWESLDDVEADRTLTIATTSVGNVLHLVASNFVDEAGYTSEALPFDSSSETTMAVANGDADLAGVEANIALPQIEAGEVIPLAIATSERLEELPDVPTFAEQGFERSHDRYSRVAVSVPAETPEEVVEVLRAAGEEAMQADSWREYAASTLLQDPAYVGDDFLAQYVPDDMEWTRESFAAAGVEEAAG